MSIDEKVGQEGRITGHRTLDRIALRSSYLEYKLPDKATHLVRKGDDYVVKECYDKNNIGKKWVKRKGDYVKIFSKKSGEHFYEWY